MVSVVRAEAVITAQDKLRPGLASAARKLEAFRKAQSKAEPMFAAQRMLDRQIGMVRKVAAVAAGYATLQGAKESVVRAADIDRQMRRAAITGDAAESRIGSATAEVRNIAFETAQPLDKVREGLEKLTSAGMQFETAMKALPAVAKSAQATGAEVAHIADTSTAMVDNFGIQADQVERAYDMLNSGGKLGKFELKDMARYLPSLLPAAKAVGMAGEDGLNKMVALLQVLRLGTGTAEEAAASARNIFQKMESEETAKKFEKMGVNLRKEMEKARKDGRDLLEVFGELTQKAIKGDMSKINQLFTDQEFSRGMLAWIGGLDRLKMFQKEIAKSAGSIDTDFKRVIVDMQSSVSQVAESFDRAKSGAGFFIAALAKDEIKAAADGLQSLGVHLEKVAQITRDKGNAVGIKALVQPVLDEVSGHSAARDEFMRPYEIARANKIASKRLNDLDAEISAYQSEPQSGLKTNPAIMEMRKRRLGELIAQRDQARLELPGVIGAGALAESQIPDIANGVAEAFKRVRDEGLYAAMESERARMRTGAPAGVPLPPRRPSDLNGSGMTPAVLDMDTAPASAKVDAVKSKIEEIGPAASTAGSALATGLSSGLSAMEAQVNASVSRMQNKLNSLKAPSLGGFNVGKAMGEAD